MNLSKFKEYIKTHATWYNKPDTRTPIDAAALMQLETGIKSNNEAIQELAAAVVSQIVNDPNKIASMAALYSVNQMVTQQNRDFGAKTLTLSEVNDASVKRMYTGQITKEIAVSIGIAGATDTFLVLHLPITTLYPSQILITASGRQQMYYRTCSNGTWQTPRLLSTKDDLEKLDHTSSKSTNLGLDLHVYRMGGVVKALYASGTHTVDWVVNTTYGLGTFGGVYAPKISWSKRIIYKYVSGNPHYAVLSMGTDGTINISPETVSHGGTLRIFETYF